jgi:hypothetical protein
MMKRLLLSALVALVFLGTFFGALFVWYRAVMAWGSVAIVVPVGLLVFIAATSVVYIQLEDK